jgi:cobalt-precorrin 5A hydrolase/precorrin-3B C17-methyltransferase
MDTFGLPFGWRLGSGDWTQVSAIAVQGHPIQVQQSAGSELWRSLFSCDHPLGKPTADPDVAPAATIFIQCQRQRPVDWPTEQPRIYWHPPVLWIGVGCERGTPACLISQAIDAVLTEYQLATDAVAGIATLTLKQDEVGLREVCADQDWPMRCFDAEQLSVIPVPNPSDQVAAAVATPSVAEAAALLAAQTVGPEATPASLIAPKQIFRVPDQPGAVTVAIAQSPWEWLGASGHLALIGTGPGALSQMTPAAQAALRDAQVVIGYGLYLDLLESQRRPGQGWEASPITQERQRAQRAIALAQWGLRVAVVSSGDAGIYGMAGLVMEELQAQGWEGQTPSVEVYPGITALQAAAARVGTPLMHDFCAISLSDLLTPWSVIEARLIAAAQADFVTALYNPRSQTRQTHLDTAQRIFLAHRDPNTPVAVVRAAYRPEESIQTSTLEKLHTLEVDMLSLVIIGNQSSRFVHQWMITPRGYLGFNKT